MQIKCKAPVRGTMMLAGLAGMAAICAPASAAQGNGAGPEVAPSHPMHDARLFLVSQFDVRMTDVRIFRARPHNCVAERLITQSVAIAGEGSAGG